jgi:3-oxoacyl-[acyl-carrier-protein] synthase-3
MPISAPASKARVTALGTYVPERIVTNDDMSRIVDTNDEWIVQRTGIRERRYTRDDEFTSHMCIAAVQNLIDRHGADVSDVDYIIVATHTPDLPFPSVACLVQAHFGISAAAAVDLNATCSGFVYGLHLANALITAGLHRKVLVIAGDTLTKITNFEDRTTCILFGDGAGAALVERTEGEGAFLAAYHGSDGTGGALLYRTGIADTLNGVPLAGGGKLVQNGREVYKFAVTTVPKGVDALLQQSGLTVADIDGFVPHSANTRILESICERTGIPFAKTLYSNEYYGNTSAASIPLALQLGVDAGRVKPGDVLLLYGFGGGLTHAGVLLRWG